MRKFIFIESNTSGTGQLCIQKARCLGFEVLFLTKNSNIYPFLNECFVHPVIIDTSNINILLAYIERLSEVVAIWSTSEYYIEICAEIAKKLQLRGANPRAISRCRDKGLFYEQLEKENVCHPETFVAVSPDQLMKISQAVSFPVVIKPAQGSGSVNVRLVYSAEELASFGSSLLRVDNNERGVKCTPKVLIQEYVDGEEYSVEILIQKGSPVVIGITKKYLGDPPCFVETGHDFPAVIETEKKELIIKSVIDAINAVSLDFGPAHVECRVKNNNLKIIEVNPRLAGGMIPVLMEKSLDIDILSKVISLYAGGSGFSENEVKVKFYAKKYCAIRFAVANKPGVFKGITSNVVASIKHCDLSYKELQSVGDRVVLRGDFRDRLGYVIACADSQKDLQKIILKINKIQPLIADVDTEMKLSGRLNVTLTPEALSIVRRKTSLESRLFELQNICNIDRAHLVMLVRCGILEAISTRKALNQIDSFYQQNFSTFINEIAPRGLYSLYEKNLIEKIGETHAGIVHTARSRNDINACLSKFETRCLFLLISKNLWRLRSALLSQAENSKDLLLPVFSQYQIGQPGSLAYYLWSLEKALSRDQASLFAIVDSINTCPLGAGSGAGTDFSIDPEITAKLLGFTQVYDSALDAIASRDLALRLLSCLSIASTTMSRLAHDYQLWSMSGQNFIELPDNLCGGSSIMPQKRNPYLLEIIKGKLNSVAFASSQSILSFHRTPFSNSMEVNTVGISNCVSTVNTFVDCCNLLRLIVTNAKGNSKAMIAATHEGMAVATQAANELVRNHGLNFHQSHKKVGSLITELTQSGESAAEKLLDMIDMNIFQAVAALKYGKGPGEISLGLNKSVSMLNNDFATLQKLETHWRESSSLLKQSVRTLLEF